MATADANAEIMAQQALAAWGLSGAACELVAVVENIVYRVRPGDGRSLVLRLHRPWYHPIEELVSERQWTQALNAYGIGAPIAVPASDGRDYVLVEAGDEVSPRYAGVSEWVDGEILAQVIAGDDDIFPHFRRLGEITARAHNQASGWTPPAGFTRHRLDADGLMGFRPFWGPFWASPALTAAERVRFEQLRRLIHDRLSRMGTDPAIFSLIHADLHPGNLVVDGERLHVIDFDDSGFGWHMYDLAVGLSSYQRHPRFDEIAEAVFAGYREVRPLDAGTAALLPLFLLVRNLAQIGWLAARPEVAGVSAGRPLVELVLALSEELAL